MRVRPASEYRALMEANAELRRERDHARAEWHRQNERADDYRRQLLDETYRPEGGEIVLRELRRAQRDRDELRVKVTAVEALIAHARKISPSPSMHVYVADLERALGIDAPRPHKLGGGDA